MNASLQTLFTAIAAVAASAVLALTLADESAAPQPVAQLERVVVTGQRAQLEQLPRVVVELRRLDGRALAQTQPSSATLVE